MADSHLNWCSMWNIVTKSSTCSPFDTEHFYWKVLSVNTVIFGAADYAPRVRLQQEAVSFSFPPYTRRRDISVSRNSHKRIDFKSEAEPIVLNCFRGKQIELCGYNPYWSLCHWYLDLMDLLLALNTTRWNSTFIPQICFVFLRGSQNKQLLFMQAALNVCFYNRDCVCLMCDTSIIFMCNSDFRV
jgi:hypothetical protein